jgi:hypothetical protein
MHALQHLLSLVMIGKKLRALYLKNKAPFGCISAYVVDFFFLKTWQLALAAHALQKL